MKTLLALLLMASCAYAADIRVNSVTVVDHTVQLDTTVEVQAIAGSVQGVELTILIPRASTIVVMDESKCRVIRDGLTEYDTSVICRIGDLGEDGTASITISTTLNPVTTFSAFVTMNGGDENPANNFGFGSTP